MKHAVLTSLIDCPRKRRAGIPPLTNMEDTWFHFIQILLELNTPDGFSVTQNTSTVFTLTPVLTFPVAISERYNELSPDRPTNAYSSWPSISICVFGNTCATFLIIPHQGRWGDEKEVVHI